MKLSDPMITRIRKFAKEEIEGDASKTVKLLPTLISMLKEQGHHASIDYISAEGMLEIARSVEESRLRHSQNENPEFELPDIPPDARYVRSLFFSPKTTPNTALLPGIWVCDVAHMTGNPSSGILFSMWGYNADRKAVCIAFGLHTLNECEASWTDFYNFVKSTYPGIDDSRATIIADGDKGGAAAYQKTFENVNFLCCTKHRGENIAMRTTAEAHGLWVKTQEAKTVAEFVERYKTMKSTVNEDHMEYIDWEYFFRNQYAVIAAYHSGSSLLGYSTSQVVESMNEAMRPVRRCHFFQALLSFIHQERRRFVKFQKEAKENVEKGFRLTPQARDKLQSLKRELEKHRPRVERINQQRSSVQHNSVSYTVDRSELSCTCGVPFVDGEPCIHVMAAARQWHIADFDLFQHQHFTSERWSAQYPEDAEFESLTLAEVSEHVRRNGFLNQEDENLALPPVKRPPRGRPRNSQRYMSALEQSRGKRGSCRVCGKRGHNIRTCPELREHDTDIQQDGSQ